MCQGTAEKTEAHAAPAGLRGRLASAAAGRPAAATSVAGTRPRTAAVRLVDPWQQVLLHVVKKTHDEKRANVSLLNGRRVMQGMYGHLKCVNAKSLGRRT